MFPQAGIWLAVYHLSLNPLISYAACHVQFYQQRSCSSFRARIHCRLAQVKEHKCIWYPRCHIWGKERLCHPETSNCTQFNTCGVHSQLFIYHREVRESDVPSQILSSIHLYSLQHSNSGTGDIFFPHPAQ